jgi:starch synthase
MATDMPSDEALDHTIPDARTGNAAHDPAGPAPDTGPPVRMNGKVLFITSEMSEFLKAGGLGEVSSALPRAMGAMCDVRVLLPGFPAVLERARSLELVRKMPGTAELPPWSLGRIDADDGLVIYVVLCDELYGRPGSPYGDGHGVDFPDNDVRFARLSLAAAEIASGEADPSWRPDIIHANDWPSALTAGYMKWKGLDTPSIFTVHNLAYQGLFDPGRLAALAIPESAFQVNGAEFHGKLSFLKAGVFYASHVTTVSETYAREIATPAHGCGLEGLLADKQAAGRLTGILNGIDRSWIDLSHDLRKQGELDDWKKTNAGRVRSLFDLSASSGPLFSIVSRLVHQKGIDLSINAADMIVRNGGQIVVTGRGEARLESEVRNLARKYPGAVSARIGFDDAEARQMFAGSDFLLMPSRYEPCGLSQMYAQSLGSLPIAYRTGGLADTIDDGCSGFLFQRPDKIGLKEAVLRAFRAFRSKPQISRMRRNAISKEYGWGGSARRYLGVYADALAR